MNYQIPPLLSNCLVLFAIYYLLLPAPAYGYFDLTTGTYILQMVLGFGAAIWLSMRTSWIQFNRKKKTTAVVTPTAGTADQAAAAAVSESTSEPGAIE